MMTMGRVLRPVMASAALVLAAACTNGELSAHDRTVVIDEAGAFLDSWLAATDRGDFDELKPMYSDRASFRWIENGRVAYDSAENAAAALDLAATGGYVADMDLMNVEISPLSADSATVSADYTLAFDFGPGAQFQSEGVFTAVLVKEGSDWKFLQGHLSEPPADLANPPSTDTADAGEAPATLEAQDGAVVESVIDTEDDPQ